MTTDSAPEEKPEQAQLFEAYLQARQQIQDLQRQLRTAKGELEEVANRLGASVPKGETLAISGFEARWLPSRLEPSQAVNRSLFESYVCSNPRLAINGGGQLYLSRDLLGLVRPRGKSYWREEGFDSEEFFVNKRKPEEFVVRRENEDLI